jgi:DNA (cytosine-5)-methyltransferase 1
MARGTLQVRRLLPTECEALQGFPKNYTAIPWRKKPASECPDGPRYKALGNSWAVPVVRWIGARIQAALMQAANDNGQRGEAAAWT